MSEEGRINRFLQELWSILQVSIRAMQDDKNRCVVGWSGPDSFTIFDQERFQKECMQEHFRIRSVHSFYRQLNMYGFKFRFTSDRLRSWSHACFTPDRTKLVEICRRAENKKQKRKLVVRPRTLEHLESELRKLTNTLQALVEENRAMRHKLDCFERGMPPADSRPEKNQSVSKPKKSIIKKKVDFEKEQPPAQPTPIINIVPCQSQLVVPGTIMMRSQSLMALEPNTQDHDLMFRRSRRNSRLLSIRTMEDQEQCRDMLQRTQYNLPMSRAITINNETGTSKILD